ncbi:MAG TPA: Gfo/Idh/MocA family oxidoreductase [Candidatus Binatia bacterium]
MAEVRRAALPVGLIGLGKHGVRYLAHLRSEVPELRLVAISRKDAARGAAQAAELGVAFHADPVELVADPAVRAVIAVVPPVEHARIVAAAAREGKPLLIEKPFAVSVRDAIAQRAALAERGVPCMVAHTLRFSPVVRELRARLELIGRPSQMVLGQSFEPTRLGWLDDPAESGGGNILHTGVHMFDLLRHVTGGEVESVSCAIERVTTKKTEDSFAASMTVALADGGPKLLATVAGSRATHSRYGELRILGERGQLFADHVHGRVVLIEDRRETELARLADEPTVLAVLREFVAVATAGATPSITPDDGLAAVAIAEACYRSAESGRRVAVWPREDVP